MRLTAIAFLLAALAACTYGPQIEPPAPQVVTVARSVDDVWTAVLVWYTDNSIPIGDMDKASGFMRSQELAAKGGDRIAGHEIGDLFDCGTDVLAHTTTGTTFVTITTLLQPVGTDSTRVRIQVAGRNHDETSEGAEVDNRCVSRGVLEPIIPRIILEGVGG